jgi:hypothetical protein
MIYTRLELTTKKKSDLNNEIRSFGCLPSATKLLSLSFCLFYFILFFFLKERERQESKQENKSRLLLLLFLYHFFLSVWGVLYAASHCRRRTITNTTIITSGRRCRHFLLFFFDEMERALLLTKEKHICKGVKKKRKSFFRVYPGISSFLFSFVPDKTFTYKVEVKSVCVYNLC